MSLIFATVFATLIVGLLGQSCEDKYKRFTFQHTLCLPQNTSCQIIKSKMTDDMKREILDYHNRYRSYVAQGFEKRAGGMPSASNMLQMVWDNELAVVVLKLLEQCRGNYDCSECRQVPNFLVGQNMYVRRSLTPMAPKDEDIYKAIKLFYDQIRNFHNSYVDSYSYSHGLGTEVGGRYQEFVQVIWAETWRVGCDYVTYRSDNGYTILVGCNYGPAGYRDGEPVYKRGNPCSYCPENTCCGKDCSNYEGLCKPKDENKPQRYPYPPGLMYCEFKNVFEECWRGNMGPGWSYFESALGGTYSEVQLNGGEKSFKEFTTKIKPTDIVNGYCLAIWYRSGPHLAGEGFNNKIVLSFKSNDALVDDETLPENPKQEYYEHRIQRDYRREVTISLHLSVPSGANRQYFNFRRIHVYNGTCD